MRSHEHGSSPKWWTISAASAQALMNALFPGKRPPRPGYGVDVADGMRLSGAYERPGHWTLYNRAGKYELMFHYR